MTPDLEAKIAVWRQKAIDNTLTTNEMTEAVLIMRAGRLGASIASAKSKKAKATAAIPAADDLLAELGRL